ncbi:peroxiredoxin [Actinokineospora sp. 24-640]
MAHDPTQLPEDLPHPTDDGAADHLVGTPMPALALPATTGGTLRVDRVPDGLDTLVLYAYPHAGAPGKPPPVPGWDLIPGTRGCTPEACGFRDHAADLRAAGAAVVGLSTQDSAAQADLVERLRLPYPILSDADHELTDALRLPTFSAGGMRMVKRITLFIKAGVVTEVFYPVFPPDTHAASVLARLRS